MKYLSNKIWPLLFLILCFAITTVHAAQTATLRAVQAPKTVKYIPVKPEFKNLTLEPMTVDSVVDELAGIVVLCSTATPNTARALPQSSQKALSSVVQLLKAGKNEAAMREWKKLINGLRRTTTPISVNELIYWVMQQAYLRSAEDLRYYAGKVKFHTEQKTIIRKTLDFNRRVLEACQSSRRCSADMLADLRKETIPLQSDMKRARKQQQASLSSMKKIIELNNNRLTQMTSMMSNMAARAHQEANSIINNMR
jgi:hypothetical protein